MSIDRSTINLDQNRFVIHFDSGNLIITLDLIQKVTQLLIPIHHIAPMALIDYLPLMDIRCTEMNRGLRTSNTFRNVHDVRHWIQRNILGLIIQPHLIDWSGI